MPSITPPASPIPPDYTLPAPPLPNTPLPPQPPAPQPPSIHDNPANPFPDLPLTDLMEEYDRIMGEMNDLAESIKDKSREIAELNQLVKELHRQLFTQGPYDAVGSVVGNLGQVAAVDLYLQLVERLDELKQEYNDLVERYNDLRSQALGIYNTLRDAARGGLIGPNDWGPVQGTPPPRLYMIGPFA